MASAPASQRRASRHATADPSSDDLEALNGEPPLKKMRYIPGGPGGGGRWIDGKGNDVPLELCPPPVRSQRGQNRPRSRHRSGDLSTPVVGPRANAVGEKGDEDEEEEEETPVLPRSTMQTRPRRERPARYVPSMSTPRPRYSNAAAAAAASQASDGYKPREERSWEDFHPDLDIGARLLIFTADEVDGRVKKDKANQQASSAGVDGSGNEEKALSQPLHSATLNVTPLKRKPGRPPRRFTSMLDGLGSPQAPRILPLPTHNPKERLNLPKPSFRQFSHFLKFEEDQKENKVNYVDRTMANVGYQESDRWEPPAHSLIRLSESQRIEDDAEVGLRLEGDGPVATSQTAPVVGRVEYDMDEQDEEWLDAINEQRRSEGVDAIKPAIFEITLTQIEKEYHALEKRIPKPQPRHAALQRPRSSSQAAVNGDPNPPGEEPDTKCSICDDGDCENANAIIFCDGCDLAVHQECYGVPFIPEGQWFCRKCKEIGRGTPTCIFCPNVDGAFKQTNTLRWSHLLCAIWIPEVTIANTTFMEPITDVDKVPKSRWKLHCYICQQRMGACIQCGNKNCYQAFHVTCARRAKLFLKMKSAHQQGIDASALKAFCDKHVPPEWRRIHDTDNATIEAKQWYRHTMKDRKWADNQTAAVELGAPPPQDGGLIPGADGESGDTIAVSNQRRRRNTNSQPQKPSWRLSSGAPVVPTAVYNAVDNALIRFTVRKRKEYVEKACRYWTLKREARRGAALLKRLQLQLEGFSTMEVTRRNFAGMGAIGRPRLIRRIQFAEMLQKDMEHLKGLCSQVRQREQLRLQELATLKQVIDTVYFPIAPMLWPILQRAQKLDEKSNVFSAGLDVLAKRLRERYYVSVHDFSRDLSLVFSEALVKLVGSEQVEAANQTDAPEDIRAIHDHLLEFKPGSKEHSGLTQEQKDLKRLAKRILKAVREPIEDAIRKESDLRGLEVHAELEKLESMGLFASEAKLPVSDVEMQDATVDERTPTSISNEHSSANVAKALTEKPGATEPLSPPVSTDSNGIPAAKPPVVASHDVLTNGGIPWYLEPFDPIGTTVHEERYTGRAVLREMSEELSDMDEDTLAEIGPSAANTTPTARQEATVEKKITNGILTSTRQTRASSNAASTAAAQESEKERGKQAKKPKRKGMGWSRPRRNR
ncbi:hypothetical protein K431DRAFT_64336 [Polychaeton citri CBS 116435]|uniref:PHD finger domain-containing protein n=1 Tax=Polychaeton citri CBS 116435 TaxID=1314669 RepID=A0A9P4Q9R5_9PEZI|nr:hypothetical protein K431DRAFT_64336 [Polychaeton citri CBS 116435]